MFAQTPSLPWKPFGPKSRAMSRIYMYKQIHADTVPKWHGLKIHQNPTSPLYETPTLPPRNIIDGVEFRLGIGFSQWDIEAGKSRLSKSARAKSRVQSLEYPKHMVNKI